MVFIILFSIAYTPDEKQTSEEGVTYRMAPSPLSVCLLGFLTIFPLILGSYLIYLGFKKSTFEKPNGAENRNENFTQEQPGTHTVILPDGQRIAKRIEAPTQDKNDWYEKEMGRLEEEGEGETEEETETAEEPEIEIEGRQTGLGRNI